MIKKYLLKAKALKPELKKTTVTADCGSVVLAQGEKTVVDFGTHLVGYLSLKLSYEGSIPDAPALLRIKFCEIEREIHEDTSDYNGWISKSWIQEEYVHADDIPSVLKLERRYAFRYVLIEVVSVSSKYKLVIDSASATAVTSVSDEVLPEGRDEFDKKIDETALRTLKNCMQYEFEDGPKRDRRLWLGDLRLEAIADYETYKNYDLVKRCLYLFAGTSNKRGEIAASVFTRPKVSPDDNYMFDYSLLFAPALCDYYKATSDAETAAELFPLARRQIELAKESFDGDVVRDSDKLGWCFIDWSLELNKQCAAQGVYIYSEKRLAELADLLGIESSGFYADAEEKAKAARSAFYDEASGLYVSGSGRQLSYASNVWMCLAGVASKKEASGILGKLGKTDAIPPVTPYMFHHYVQALVDCGDVKSAEKEMREYWGGMVKNGADTFWELYDPNDPFASPYGSNAVNSYCHAWSCTPSYFIRRYFNKR